MTRGLVVALMLGLSAIANAETPIERGLALFEDKRYAQAIVAFEEAYKQSPEPKLLYSIAQAYRLDGNCAGALAYYQRYLEEMPKATNARAVRHRIAQMTACAAEHKLPPADPQPEHAEPRPDPAAAPESGTAAKVTHDPSRQITRRESGTVRVAGIVTAIAGAAFAGTGAYFAYDARAAQHDVEDLFARGGVWDAELEERGKRSSWLAIGFFVGAGGAIAAGTVMYVVGGPREVVIESNNGRTAVSWRGSF